MKMPLISFNARDSVSPINGLQRHVFNDLSA